MKTMMLAALAVAALAGSASAGVVFDFEGESTTSGGALTTLSMTNSGLSLDLSRESGAAFDIVNDANRPASWGSRSLIPSLANLGNTWFVANLSQSASAVSIEMGDFAPSDSDTLRLEAYSGANATGTLLGSTSLGLAELNANGFNFLSLLVSGGGINSFRFIGGSEQYPNSVYYDNINVTVSAVPLPGAGFMGLGMLAGLGGFAWVRRRRTASAI